MGHTERVSPINKPPPGDIQTRSRVPRTCTSSGKFRGSDRPRVRAPDSLKKLCTEFSGVALAETRRLGEVPLEISVQPCREYALKFQTIGETIGEIDETERRGCVCNLYRIFITRIAVCYYVLDIRRRRNVFDNFFFAK